MKLDEFSPFHVNNAGGFERCLIHCKFLLFSTTGRTSLVYGSDAARLIFQNRVKGTYYRIKCTKPWSEKSEARDHFKNSLFKRGDGDLQYILFVLQLQQTLKTHILFRLFKLNPCLLAIRLSNHAQARGTRESPGGRTLSVESH
jgi:hypothetical protein